jgi:hypothetical protein
VVTAVRDGGQLAVTVEGPARVRRVELRPVHGAVAPAQVRLEG